MIAVRARLLAFPFHPAGRHFSELTAWLALFFFAIRPGQLKCSTRGEPALHSVSLTDHVSVTLSRPML